MAVETTKTAPKEKGAEIQIIGTAPLATIVRAVTFPVVEPMSGDWKDLRASLRQMWALTTQASNWIMRELYIRDVRRNGEPKMPKYEHHYLYPELRLRFPDLPPQTVASLERAVTRKYKARRYETVWTCAASLPTFRYPTPFPIHNQSWDCWFDDGNRPIVNPRIADKHRELRLRGGARYGRQLASFRQMADGQVKRGEMAIFRVRNAATGKHDIMVKMVAHLSVRANSLAEGELYCSTGKDSLLSVLDVDREKLWIYHGNHIQRWAAEHKYRMECWADDSKPRSRGVPPPFAERRTLASDKYRRRLASATHEASRGLVEYCRRRKVATLYYDDSERGFAGQFSWFELKLKIEQKLKEFGIAFVYIGNQDGDS